MRKGPQESRIPRAAVLDRRLKPADRMVIGLLGCHTDAEGRCRRSQSRMAEELGLTRRSVNRAVARLVSLGYLEVEARKQDGGRARISSDYRLLEPQLQDRLFEADEYPPETLVSQGGGTRESQAPGTPGVPPITLNDTSLNDAGLKRARKPHPAPPQGQRELLPAVLVVDNPVPVADTSKQPNPNSGADRQPVWGKPDLDRLEAQLRDAGGGALNSASPGLIALSAPLAWLAGGCDLEADVLPAIRAVAHRRRGRPIADWSYFEAPVLEARDRRLRARPPPPRTAERADVEILQPRSQHERADPLPRESPTRAALRRLHERGGLG